MGMVGLLTALVELEVCGIYVSKKYEQKGANLHCCLVIENLCCVWSMQDLALL